MLPTASGAVAPQLIAGNGTLYLMPGQLLSNVWGCYVLDTENQTLCAYAYSGSLLQLKCSRSIRHDHELEDYNTSPPPAEIRKLVEIQKGKVHGIVQPAPEVVPPVDTEPATTPAVGPQPSPTPAPAPGPEPSPAPAPAPAPAPGPEPSPVPQ